MHLKNRAIIRRNNQVKMYEKAKQMYKKNLNKHKIIEFQKNAISELDDAFMPLLTEVTLNIYL